MVDRTADTERRARLDRLASLNRAPLAQVGDTLPSVLPANRGAAARIAPHWYARQVSPQPAAVPLRRKRVALADVLRGDITEMEPHGRILVLTTHAAGLDTGAAKIASRCAAVYRQTRGDVDPDEMRARPDSIAFLDIETGGLGNAIVFLVGILRWSGGVPTITQILARDYSEEAPLLASVLATLSECVALVTFNGKSFDVPMLRLRSGLHHIRFAVPQAHLDLLHICRRQWRAELPDCRLQTLERRICGRTRSDDIPGSEVPEAYHHFVRSGDAADLVRIVRHNADDLVTLAELLLHLPD